MTLASPSGSTTAARYDAIVVGGGFYGARLALRLRARLPRVLLVEREPRLLARASLFNQARVHNGYHYPRSILTSLRSRVNYSRFVGEYGECVDRTFPHYYAVARGMSKTTGAQFAEFCRRIEAPVRPAPKEVAALFDPARIDAVFEVEEGAFDAVRLRARMETDLAAAGVELSLETEATRAAMQPDGRTARVTLRLRGAEWTAEAPVVINSTYSRLNDLLIASGASPIPVKLELAELALVEPPAELRGAAVTVMDGPFFSLVPYPSCGLHTMSHVRYTPHCSWTGAERGEGEGDAVRAAHGESRFVHMVRDAERFLPLLRRTRYVNSLWEVKALMPQSEWSDSRPILLRRSDELPACISVLGAKIDSVYDVEDSLAALLWSAPPETAPVPRPTPGRASKAIAQAST